MCNLTDRSPSRGVYYGDLAYGRAEGNTPKPNKDYVACVDENGVPSNMPCVRLVLVTGRDPEVWKKDPAVKEAKKWPLDGNWHANNVVLTTFKELYDSGRIRSNIRLRIGKELF